MKYALAAGLIIVSAFFGYWAYSVNYEKLTVPSLGTSALTYITIGEDGTNCVIKVPASVEGDLAEMGVYNWLAACKKQYGDD